MGGVAGSGRGQVDVGQRARTRNENGVKGAGLGAPGDGDVVTGGFAEAVQLFGPCGNGVLGTRVVQR
jgi:hypothetical protein